MKTFSLFKLIAKFKYKYCKPNASRELSNSKVAKY